MIQFATPVYTWKIPSTLLGTREISNSIFMVTGIWFSYEFIGVYTVSSTIFISASQVCEVTNSTPLTGIHELSVEVKPACGSQIRPIGHLAAWLIGNMDTSDRRMSILTAAKQSLHNLSGHAINQDFPSTQYLFNPTRPQLSLVICQEILVSLPKQTASKITCLSLQLL